MIDLTPLDVRKKRGDFTKGLRGYDTQQVDSFLELVAERLEEVVKENLTLRERVDRLSEQVDAQSGREQAVNDALVTAQQLREEIQSSAQREAELLRRETESEARELRREAELEANRLREEARAEAARTVQEAERALEEQRRRLQELERRRVRFLASFRQLLERELDMVAVQEEREPLDESPVDLELRGGRVEPDPGWEEEPDPAVAEADPGEPAPEPERDPSAEARERDPRESELRGFDL